MKSTRGFTLAEVLIAAVVFAIVSVAAFNMMTGSRKTAETTSRKSQMTGMIRTVMDSIKKDFHKTRVYNTGTETTGPDASPNGTAGNQFYVRLSEKFCKTNGTYTIELSQDGKDPATTNKKAVYEVNKSDETLKRNGKVIAENLKEFIMTHDTDLDGNLDPKNENAAKIFVKVTLMAKFKDDEIKSEQSQIVTSPGVLSVVKNTFKSLDSRADDF